jgi:hypothetical protein
MRTMSQTASRKVINAQRKNAVIGFFAGLLALLFLVKGPIQHWLSGEGLTIAWPLYTLVGASIAVIAGFLSGTLLEVPPYKKI